MRSNVQLVNRRPVKKSTGTSTIETGIRASAEVTPAEDSAELVAIEAQFTSYFQPTTPEERALGDIAVRSEWVLRRMARIEANYWRLKDHEAKFIPELHLDASFVLDSNFSRLQWRINSAQRNLFGALDRLRVLRASSAPAAPAPVIIDVTPIRGCKRSPLRLA